MPLPVHSRALIRPECSSWELTLLSIFSGLSPKMSTSNRNAGRQSTNPHTPSQEASASLWDRKPVAAKIMCPNPDMPSGAASTGSLPLLNEHKPCWGAGGYIAGWLKCHPFYFLFKEPSLNNPSLSQPKDYCESCLVQSVCNSSLAGHGGCYRSW